jgi:hypothetical protein
MKATRVIKLVMKLQGMFGSGQKAFTATTTEDLIVFGID